mgnify:CR=1 FL=1
MFVLSSTILTRFVLSLASRRTAREPKIRSRKTKAGIIDCYIRYCKISTFHPVGETKCFVFSTREVNFVTSSAALALTRSRVSTASCRCLAYEATKSTA